MTAHDQASKLKPVIAWVAPRRIRHIMDDVKNFPAMSKYNLNLTLHSSKRNTILEDLLLYQLVVIEVPSQMNYTPFVHDLIHFVTQLHKNQVRMAGSDIKAILTWFLCNCVTR